MARITQAMPHVAGTEAPDNFRIALDTVCRCNRHASSSETGPYSGTNVHDTGRLRTIQQPKDPRNEITNVDPIAQLESVFEQTWPLTGPNPSCHLGNDRRFPIVQPETRAINRRESQDVHRAVVKALETEFLHILRCTVRFQWRRGRIFLDGDDLGDRSAVGAINFVALGKEVRFLARSVGVGTALGTRVRIVRSIDTEASGKDHTFELGPAPGVFKESCRPPAVRIDYVCGFPGRPPNSAERRKVNDRFNVLEARIGLQIAKIRKAVVHIVAQIVRRAVMYIWIQTVDCEHLNSVCRRAVNDVGSNKASCACDEYLHASACIDASILSCSASNQSTV